MKTRKLKLLQEKYDYVPSHGLYIWKYKDEKSSGLQYFMESTVILFGTVFLAAAFLVLTVFASPVLNNYVFNYRSPAFQGYLKSNRPTISRTSTVSGITSILFFIHNSLYVGKQIARIDDDKVIEQIMESGQSLNLFGKNSSFDCAQHNKLI